MFQTTAAMKKAAYEERVRPLLAEYDGTREFWYDGSMDSVTERIAKCDEVISVAENALLNSGAFAEVTATLKQEHRELVAYQDDFLRSESRSRRVHAQSEFHKTAFSKLPKVAQKWVTLESQKFIEANCDVVFDRKELLTRAANYVVENTSQLKSARLNLLVAAFQHEIDSKMQVKSLRTAGTKRPQFDFNNFDDRTLLI